MFRKILELFLDARDRQRINIALSKGLAGSSMRSIDLTLPYTWEFSGFSQNGEDGILDVLINNLENPNRYFIEIGSSDGIENNCAWLAVVKRYRGIMIEGNPRLARRANRTIARSTIGVDYCNIFVSEETMSNISSLSSHLNPDVLSLDIDGVDYYIAKEVFNAGFRPKIFVVEYNSVYGPDRRLTVPYRKDFDFGLADVTRLYYGASIAAWRKLFDDQGYVFVTVDSNGVNGFFIDPMCFDPIFIESIKRTEYAENQYQLMRFRKCSADQFQLIRNKKFVEI